MNYKNFNLAIYCPATTLASYQNKEEELKKDIDFFQKYLKLDKVYLETHRTNVDIPKKEMKKIISIFEGKGLKIAGGITPTTGNNQEGQRFLNVYCYTKKKMRQEIKEISKYTASLFDEFILDDFFFSNCSCPSCIEKKGDLTWEEFRLKLMKEVSENLIIKPARKINPDLKIIIKFPNWIESFQETGYNTKEQSELFDFIYTGTETRDTKYTHQHLPRYASYSLMRWMENVKPGFNGGGWFDWIDCIHNIGYYLEQAYLTAFSKAKELMLFSFGGLKNSAFVPALGHELDRLDNISDNLGEPIGIYVYEPHHADGEDHLYDYLGMLGIPLEPVPYFPKSEASILLTANSSKDPEIMKKVKDYLSNGGDLIMTSGFVEKMQGKGIRELSSVKYTNRKVHSSQYGIETSVCAFANYTDHHKGISFPVLNYKNNASWPIITAIKEEDGYPILLHDHYGLGNVYTLTIPDNYSDLYNLPIEVLNKIRQVFLDKEDIYIEGHSKIALFLYDNNTLIIESFLPHRSETNLIIKANNVELYSLDNNEKVQSLQLNNDTCCFNIKLEPTTYHVFKYKIN
ncbi:permease [Natronospora cellulosivora (SeqCode)]